MFKTFIKPHIRVITRPYMYEQWWLCADGEYVGTGSTPESAYRDWHFAKYGVDDWWGL